MSAKEAGSDSATLVRGAGIVSVVLAFIAAPIGLVVSIATYVWASKTGLSTKLAIWGIVLSIVMIIVGIVVTVIVSMMLFNAINAGAIDVGALCQHRDQWGWLIDSLRYACR